MACRVVGNSGDVVLGDRADGGGVHLQAHRSAESPSPARSRPAAPARNARPAATWSRRAIRPFERRPGARVVVGLRRYAGSRSASPGEHLERAPRAGSRRGRTPHAPAAETDDLGRRRQATATADVLVVASGARRRVNATQASRAVPLVKLEVATRTPVRATIESTSGHHALDGVSIWYSLP